MTEQAKDQNCSAKGKCRFFQGHTGDLKTQVICEIGYTQNPKTEEATRNAINAGAEVCNLNQWKRKAINERR